MTAVYARIVETAAALGVLHVFCHLHHLSALVAIILSSSLQCYECGLLYAVSHSISITCVALYSISLISLKEAIEVGDICFHVVGGLSLFVLGIQSMRCVWSSMKKAEFARLWKSDTVNLRTSVQESKRSQKEVTYTIHEGIVPTQYKWPRWALGMERVRALWEARVMLSQHYITAKCIVLHGLLQGVAGATGLLGVHPVMVLYSYSYASVYMIVFNIFATITTIIVAVACGRCIQRLERSFKPTRALLGSVAGIGCLCASISWLTASARRYWEIFVDVS